jgi:hypothetical protein
MDGRAILIVSSNASSNLQGEPIRRRATQSGWI